MWHRVCCTGFDDEKHFLWLFLPKDKTRKTLFSLYFSKWAIKSNTKERVTIFGMDDAKFYGTGLQENDKPRTTYFSNGQLFTQLSSSIYKVWCVLWDKTQYKGEKTICLYGIIPAVPCFLSSLLAAVIIQNLNDENCQSGGGLRLTEGTLLVSSSFVCVSERWMRVCLLLSATLLFHFPASRLFQQRRVYLSQRKKKRRSRGGKKNITPDEN